MPFIVGVVLALIVGVFAKGTGLDRDRAFYPLVTIVIATYYVLFAAMSASNGSLWLDSAIAIAFVVAAVAGFRRSLWVVVMALAAHGVLDFIHDRVISNPSVPYWWPDFCLAYDVAAAAYLGWSLKTGRVRAVA